MKSFSTLATLSLTLLSISMPAMAQHEMRRGGNTATGENPGDVQHPFLRRGEQRKENGNAEQAVLREAPAGQQAEELKPARTQGLVPPGRERLSPEERRQLRRDINAAGRDIYRRQRPQ